jgi:hypothetical protein
MPLSQVGGAVLGAIGVAGAGYSLMKHRDKPQEEVGPFFLFTMFTRTYTSSRMTRALFIKVRFSELGHFLS